MIYVANSASNSMSVIDGSNNSVTSVLTGTFPYGVAVDSATNRVYVTNNSDDSVSVFTGAGVPVGLIVDPSLEGPLGVAVNPVTNTIYVANGGCPCGTTVSVINGLTNTVVTVITVGDRPSAIAVNSVTNRIYVTNAADGNRHQPSHEQNLRDRPEFRLADHDRRLYQHGRISRDNRLWPYWRRRRRGDKPHLCRRRIRESGLRRQRR
jgi:YVTN family beta-propeller protein